MAGYYRPEYLRSQASPLQEGLVRSITAFVVRLELVRGT